MRRWLLLLVVLLLSIPCSHALAQHPRPKFTGVWELDAARSSAPAHQPGAAATVTQEIQHHPPNLTVRRMLRNRDGDHTLVLYLSTDGKEHVNDVDGHPLGFRSRWKGNRMVTDVRDLEAMTAPALHEIWMLSADGRMLTIELSMSVGKGGGKGTLVYVRKRK